MKKVLLRVWVLVAFAMTLPMAVSAQPYWDGTCDTEWEGLGTADSPYLISTAEELAGLAKRTNADETFEGVYFRLTADLYLSDPNTSDEEKPLWEPIGQYILNNDDSETNPGGFYKKEYWFKGSFDGGGHAIYNLWYTGSTDFEEWNDPFGSGQLDFTAWNKALFGLTDGAVISDLRLENANIAGTALIAGLVIRAKNSTFTDVHVSGHIKSGDYSAGGSAGGLAVEAENSHFERCSSSADVFGFSRTGGLIGFVSGASTVENCSSNGNVTGSVYIGGLIGVSDKTEGDESGNAPIVRQSTSSATVIIINGRNQGNYGAGFIGYNGGVISQCGAIGKVDVRANAGAGFCHENMGHIESCYSTADVINENYGTTLSSFVVNNGLDVGYSSEAGSIYNCYGAGSVSAPASPDDVITSGTHIAGFVSANHLSAGSYLANCYYDNTRIPKIEIFGLPGEYGIPTEYMQSEEFVDSLNMMAAVMGTHLWQYNPGAYPTPTDVMASDVRPFFDGGKGTEAEPFLVADKQQLKNLAYAANRNWEFRGQYIRQTADIALNAPMETWGEQMPELWTPIASFGDNSMNEFSHHFSGIYDGDMHTVQNMYMDNNAKYLGLFGVLGANAVIRNLGVVDAWVNGDANVGILVGGTNVQNDPCAEGPRTISHCWTSGSVTGGSANGGIVGRSWGGEKFTMVACYSTASAKQGLIGNNYVNDTFVYGSWYGGEVSPRGFAFSNTDGYFMTFVDSDKNPVRKENLRDYPFGRTTRYMQSKEFVNELNYAAAAKGYEGGWGYNEGAYPSFTGVLPTIRVTLNDGVSAPVSFLAFEGSSLARPEIPGREGYVLEGWYIDAEYSTIFDFGTTLLTEPVTLYARWTEPVGADYEVFKNKFSNTYTLTTAAQLYGFANIVNGTAEGMDRSDFAGKTVKLGADIELNDISSFNMWGTSVCPLEFTAIGYNESRPFNGTFDGQGHSIKGMYIALSDYSDGKCGFFGHLGKDAVVRDLKIEKGYIVKHAEGIAGLLAVKSNGTVLRCGTDGRIVSDITSGYYSYNTVNGGLIGVAGESSKVSECYALVDMDVLNERCGGLIGSLNGTLDNSFAKGSVRYGTNGTFGGLVGWFDNDGYSNCYSAVSVVFGEVPGTEGNFGGSYGKAAYNASVIPGIYDRDLVNSAFNMLQEEHSIRAYGQGIGKTTAEMKTMAAYTGWDFVNVWGRRDDKNSGYPYLRWTSPGLDNDADNINVGVGQFEIDNDTRVNVFTLDGRSIYTGRLSDANLCSGIYIVKAGQTVKKIGIR